MLVIKCIEKDYVPFPFSISIPICVVLFYDNCIYIAEPSECTNGDVRLVDGYISQQGRVETCVNGVWGNLCATGWNKASAFIACKKLGLLNSGE